jgi:nicotinamidase-related amidase/alkylated DNA repair dioxygenase AlkB
MVSKMSSLMDLVSQNQPHFQTHQALLVIGMQNDFIQPDGRLPVSTDNGYLERIQTLIPKFRKLNGNVIWVQTLYEGDRIANDASTGEGDALVVGGLIDGEESGTDGGEEELFKDLPPEKTKSSKHKQRALDLLKRVSARRKTLPREVARATVEQDDELFLLKGEKSVPACVPDTHGAQFADVIAMQFELPADMVIRTTNYSAFQGTSLLMTLRAKLVTELYICGCITNVSVLATVIDAARHGVKINVIEDCLGYRKQNRHELALKRMDELFDAYLVNSTEILAREPSVSAEKKPTSPNSSMKGPRGSDNTLEAMAGRLSLNDAEARPSSRSQGMRSPTKVLTGGQRQLSLVSVAENRKAVNGPPTITEPTDGEFADNLVRGAVLSGAAGGVQTGEKQEVQLVTKKIRMRSKGKRKKKKKTEGEVTKEEVEHAAGNGEASTSASHDTAEAAQPDVAPSVPVVPSTTGATTSLPSLPESEVRRGSLLSRAESVLNLREKMSKPQPLKSVASQPVLSGKAEAKDKEKDRDSWSDRMRMSLSRTPKTESASDSRNRMSYISLKAPSTPSKAESRRTSIAATISEAPLTPSKVTESSVKETLETVEPPMPMNSTSDPTTNNATISQNSKLQSLANLPTLGPEDVIGEGDSRIIHDFFPPDLKHPSEPSKPFRDVVFTQIYNEVRWQKMLHQQGEVPRLVCCQGEFGDDGSMPVYRHPSDQSLSLLHFSPSVQAVRKRAEELVGHPLNHVLIQLYRSGGDYISEHSDKTLDIVKGSSIVNVSLGAQRTMRLRTKTHKPTNQSTPEERGEDSANERTTQRIHLPHNSLFVLGLATNAAWLHGIQPDKRMASERSPSELAYNGVRISLTFRHIGTFIDARESVIWGQGATEKEQRDAADVINNDEFESSKMILAFSRENRDADFSWDEHYSNGFDVLHLHAAPPDLPVIFASNNAIETAQARLCLWESKLTYTLVEAPTLENEFELDRQVAFRDTDTLHTEVVMSSSILMYLDRYYPLDSSPHSRPCTASAYATIVLTAGVLKAWMNYSAGVPTYLAEFKNLLAVLEDKVKTEGGPFVAGRRFSIADCYVWPVVDDVVADWDEWDEGVYPTLVEWWRMTARKKACVKRLREEREKGKGKGKEKEMEVIKGETAQ